MAALTGNTIASTYKDLLQVSNSNSGVDGTLRNVEDGEGTASALQVSTGAINVSGTITASGNVDFNGDLDVDGTTNLDAVDIDGAVDVAGASTFNNDVSIISASSGSPTLLVKNTNDDGEPAYMQFIKDTSNSAADNDEIVKMEFYHDNDANSLIRYGAMIVSATDVSNGSEDTKIKFMTRADSTDTETLTLQSGKVGIGGTPSDTLHLQASIPIIRLTDTDTSDYHRIYGSNGGLYLDADKGATVSNSKMAFGVDDGTRFVLNANSVISLSNNDNGSSNTIFGDSAADSLDAGSNFNVFIGKSVATGSLDDASDNVAVGFESMKAIIQGDDNVAVGMRTLLDLEDGSNNTAIGDSVLRACVDASDNTAVGAFAMDATTTGNNNVAMGKNALGNTADVDKCVAIGSAAMSQSGLDSNGDGTVAIGYFAGGNLTAGAHGNVAIGANANMEGTTGDRNLAIGYSALASTGNRPASDDNIAIGYQAMGGSFVTADSEYNIAIGNFALDANLNEANANICMGYSALTACTTGDANVAIGHATGNTISSGTGNVLIGYQAGTDTVALSTGNNNICIGTNTRTSANSNDNSIAIGHDIDSAANQVSIGKSGNKIYNEFDTDNAWTQSSDVRLKKDIQDSTLGLDFVNDLRPVTYQWKSSNELPKDFAHYNKENNKTTGVTMTGLIAQEVKEAIDKSGVERFAGWAEDRDGVQQVSKEMFVFPLIKAVQELTAKVEELETKLNNKES